MDICYPVTIRTDFVNQQQEPHIHYYGLMKNFFLIFRLQEFIERMTRVKDRYWIETDNFIEFQTTHKTFKTKEYKEKITLCQNTTINRRQPKSFSV